VVGLRGGFRLGSVQAREFFTIFIIEADPSGDADRLWRERSQVPQSFQSHGSHNIKALEVDAT